MKEKPGKMRLNLRVYTSSVPLNAFPVMKKLVRAVFSEDDTHSTLEIYLRI